MVLRPNHSSELGLFAEVEDQANVKLGRLQVVTNLKKVLGNDRMSCLDFDDDLGLDYQICPICSGRLTSEQDLIRDLSLDCEARIVHYYREAFLIY